MDSKQVLARFEAERQALAMMDHPNIAKVLEAGTTKDGLPYFVMDLVKGFPITDYCDEHELTTRQRLSLIRGCVPCGAACTPERRDSPGSETIQHFGSGIRQSR